MVCMHARTISMKMTGLLAPSLEQQIKERASYRIRDDLFRPLLFRAKKLRAECFVIRVFPYFYLVLSSVFM